MRRPPHVRAPCSVLTAKSQRQRRVRQRNVPHNDLSPSNRKKSMASKAAQIARSGVIFPCVNVDAWSVQVTDDGARGLRRLAAAPSPHASSRGLFPIHECSPSARSNRPTAGTNALKERWVDIEASDDIAGRLRSTTVGRRLPLGQRSGASSSTAAVVVAKSGAVVHQ
jgi:hypothetical protein